MFYFGISFYGCKKGINSVELSELIKIDFQKKIEADKIYSAYGIITNSVLLVQKGKNTYDGIVDITIGEKSYLLGINVIVDGKSFIWQPYPNSFNFLNDFKIKE